MESYEQEAKSGKELNKDQKEALAKYPEVLGQIECVKELSEQFKKIQIEVVLVFNSFIFKYLVFSVIKKSKTSFKTTSRRETSISHSTSS